MNPFQWHRMGVLAPGLALFMGLAGCATGGGGNSGSLSAAVAESADEKDEEAQGRGQGRTRTKNDVSTSDSQDDYQDYYSEEDSGGGSTWLAGLIWGLFSGGEEDEYTPGSADKDEKEEKNTRHNLIFWYSMSHLAGDAIQGFSTGTLAYSSFRGPRFRGHIGLYFSEGTLGGQEKVREGISWLREFGLVTGFRHYYTDDQSFMGFYFLAELDLGVMSWSYTNPIEAPAEDGGTVFISDDDLFVITPRIGLGISLVQTKVVHLGAGLSYGVRFPVGKTFREFENDLFKDVGEFKLKLEASIFF